MCMRNVSTASPKQCGGRAWLPGIGVSRSVRLQGSGKEFAVMAGETILEAARRCGLALPYSCLAGVCGSCKATLIEGECDYPRNPPSALNSSERARGQILLCQAVPRSDLIIAAREIASLADMPLRRLSLRLEHKNRLTHDAMLLVLKSPAGDHLRRLPGQYLDVLLADGKRRAFSIANAPHANTTIELHVRHVAGGGFTSWVFDTLQAGDSLDVEGPLGTFVPREDSERPLLMVAGGTGFAPIKALIEHFLDLGSRREITLYWGARSPQELYLQDLLGDWTRDTATFHYVPVMSDPERAGQFRRGFVHEAVIEDHPDLTGFDVYMSGPPAMIDAGRRSFVQSGLLEERMYFDSFDYAPDVLAQILRGRAGIDGARVDGG